MLFLWVNVTFYDAVNMIHDVITTANRFPDTTKFMFADVRNNYCIKPTLPVRYEHVLTGENRALTGENAY